MNIRPFLSYKLLVSLGLCFVGTSFALDGPATAKIHLVYMGGNDCPPCAEWRRTELPKLQEMAAFKSIQFSYVTKTIRSPVPSSLFLPSEVKPYKEKLDIASTQRGGSSQTAILVDGEVYDYYHGTRSAKEIEAMILAIQTGQEYPFQRCTKVAGWKRCAVKG